MLLANLKHELPPRYLSLPNPWDEWCRWTDERGLAFAMLLIPPLTSYKRKTLK